MVTLHDLCWNFLFSRQMICKQHIALNHMFFRYESNLRDSPRWRPSWTETETPLALLEENPPEGNPQ